MNQKAITTVYLILAAGLLIACAGTERLWVRLLLLLIAVAAGLVALCLVFRI